MGGARRRKTAPVCHLWTACLVVKLYRIASLNYKIFSGIGAAMAGGRWNSVGQHVIYAATSIALARLEKMVQLAPRVPPLGLGQVAIDVPDAASKEWYHEKTAPKKMRESQELGDAWLRSQRSLILFVPSIASDGDFNALINPAHPEFDTLTVGPETPVLWDERLFR
jgi:RES domain-containing protein